MVKDHSDSERKPAAYSFPLAARVLLYASSHKQDNTYHGLCYNSRVALAGTRNRSMGPPDEESIRRANAHTTELHLMVTIHVHVMKENVHRARNLIPRLSAFNAKSCHIC